MAFTMPRVANAMNAVGYSVGQDEPMTMSVAMSPNPTSGAAYIRVEGAKINQVVVMDILGRLIYESTVAAAREVELPSHLWPGGSYIVRVETDHGTQTLKLIRE